MADKEKKTKKKKDKEDAPAETRTSSKSSSKKAKRSGSNVFSMFSQAQVAEFKEGFALMDHDKDGIISKADLRATFDAVGKLSNEKELDEMLGEASGPINFTQLLSLFGNRMADSGGSDEDTVVVAAFKSFDENGTIDSERFRHALMTWGDKFSGKEVDDAFDCMEIDDRGRIDTENLIKLLTAAPEDEGERAKPPKQAQLLDTRTEQDHRTNVDYDQLNNIKRHLVLFSGKFCCNTIQRKP